MNVSVVKCEGKSLQLFMRMLIQKPNSNYKFNTNMKMLETRKETKDSRKETQGQE
jgi:hypothetical protein